MSLELRLLDTIKFSTHLSRNFACDSSEDNRFSFLTDFGVYILDLKCSLTSPFPDFSCSKYFLQVSNFIPAEDIDLDVNSFHRDLDRKDLYETVLTNEYSANLNNIKPLEVYPLCSEWSPRNITNKTGCLLGVLSSLNNLEIFVKILDENEFIEYYCVVNVTKSVIEEEKKNWTNSTRFPIALKFDEFKKRIANVLPSAFTWSHVFEVDNENSCVIFLGHLNGNITVWRINEVNTKSLEDKKLEFLGRYSTELKRISTMYFHRTSEFGGALCFGDIDGRVNILHVTELDKKKACLDKELYLFAESDNVSVEKITVIEQFKKTFILVVKQAVLIIYGIDEYGQVFDRKVQYIEEFYITGLHCFQDFIFVLSLPGIFSQFQLFVKNNEIQLNEMKIPFKIDKLLYRTHGFFISKNMMFMGVLTYPWELQQFSKNKSFVNLFIYNNVLLNPFEILWKNSSGSLRDYWDCFEVLRLLCIKEKRFPWLGLPANLNYDELSLHQLKTLRYIAQLSENVYEVVPLVKNYDIKSFILLHYLVEIKLVIKRLKKLLTMKSEGKELSVFQMRSIDIQNFYLKEIVVKNILAKSKVAMNFTREITEVMEIANELRYPDMMQCIWCGEKIIGLVCLPPHADMRCSLSMMPIFLIPAYKCLFCKALAHKEMEEEEDILFCPYCDIPMEQVHMDPEKYEEKATKLHVSGSGEVRSDCFEDCLKEEIGLEDIEDNISDYIIFSDSECEDDGPDRLHQLYVKMSNCSLEELSKLDSNSITVESNKKKRLSEDSITDS